MSSFGLIFLILSLLFLLNVFQSKHNFLKNYNYFLFIHIYIKFNNFKVLYDVKDNSFYWKWKIYMNDYLYEFFKFSITGLFMFLISNAVSIG